MKNIKKLVKAITGKLDTYGYNYEMNGDDSTFAIAPTASILTKNCTIEVYRDQITVNEKQVCDLDEMIEAVIEVEGI